MSQIEEMRTPRPRLRLTDDAHQLASTAATELDETLSDFFRRAATTSAYEAIAERIALNQSEAARLLDALDTVDQGTVARLRELHEHVT
jgi:uncharacterized protein (DUF1778 family)